MDKPPISKDQAWENVRKYAESLSYGRIELIIKDGMPVQGNTPMQNVKFDKAEDDSEFRVMPIA